MGTTVYATLIHDDGDHETVTGTPRFFIKQDVTSTREAHAVLWGNVASYFELGPIEDARKAAGYGMDATNWGDVLSGAVPASWLAHCGMDVLNDGDRAGCFGGHGTISIELDHDERLITRKGLEQLFPDMEWGHIRP